jgi:ADP-dependent NAD(P)H-hydrate dehydratase / NAD(P)H-hydrate epimerase
VEPVLTPAQMRAADDAAIAAGTPEAVLMDRAAFACAVTALRMLGGGYGRRVVVVAGKGNNGGDGVVCARHLRRKGVHVTVLETRAWSRADFDRATTRADLVIDAILGTGFSGSPRDGVADAIAAIATCQRPVLAIDIASGVNGEDGSVPGVAVKADVTVAIQTLKVGHVQLPGAVHCGRIDVCDIGIAAHDVQTFVPTWRDVRAVLPEREGETHKYKVGTLAVLAGSAGMTGAAVLTAHGAIRSGAGLVMLGVPASTLDVFEHAVTEAIKVPLPDVEGQLDAKSVDEFADRLERAKAIATGPGLGRGPRAIAVTRGVLGSDLPTVVDGDGLWALAEILREEPEVLKERSAPTVLTPHTGEFSLLTGADVPDDRRSAAVDAAARFGAVVHLKGRRAITASPAGIAWINTTGNPGAATGGTGDVLTGIVGSLLAQGVMAEAAAWAGAFLHGAAADLVAERTGEASLRASDLPEALPRALMRASRATPNVGALRTVLP